jgi:hypothetical protein
LLSNVTCPPVPILIGSNEYPTPEPQDPLPDIITSVPLSVIDILEPPVIDLR